MSVSILEGLVHVRWGTAETPPQAAAIDWDRRRETRQKQIEKAQDTEGYRRSVAIRNHSGNMNRLRQNFGDFFSRILGSVWKIVGSPKNSYQRESLERATGNRCMFGGLPHRTMWTGRMLEVQEALPGPGAKGPAHPTVRCAHRTQGIRFRAQGQANG